MLDKAHNDVSQTQDLDKRTPKTYYLIIHWRFAHNDTFKLMQNSIKYLQISFHIYMQCSPVIYNIGYNAVSDITLS